MLHQRQLALTLLADGLIRLCRDLRPVPAMTRAMSHFRGRYTTADRTHMTAVAPL